MLDSLLGKKSNTKEMREAAKRLLQQADEIDARDAKIQGAIEQITNGFNVLRGI